MCKKASMTVYDSPSPSYRHLCHMCNEKKKIVVELLKEEIESWHMQENISICKKCLVKGLKMIDDRPKENVADSNNKIS